MAIEKLAKKMQRGYFKKPTKLAAEKDTGEDQSVADRKRGNRRAMLTPAEKVDIVHQVLVQHRMVKDIAKANRVTPMHVGMLVSRAKKNPKFIAEIFNKEENSGQKQERIEKVVQEMVQKDEFIDSCKAVVKRTNIELQDSAVSEAETRKVMLAMGMKYRKVHHIAMSANSERSLVLRQQWAVTLLKALQDYRS